MGVALAGGFDCCCCCKRLHFDDKLLTGDEEATDGDEADLGSDEILKQFIKREAMLRLL